MTSPKYVTPTSSRGGRRFEPVAERDLHDLVSEVALSLPGVADDVLIVPEMPSPLGLPDFVAVVNGSQWLHARAAAGVPPLLSLADCIVLSASSPSRPLTVQTIARRIGWSVEAAVQTIERLERLEAIIKTRSGAVRANPSIKPQGSLFAIEAKVKEWRRAVFQGRNYRTWANNYVIVLGDVGVSAEGRARTSVSEDGAGLFTRQGWSVKPRARRPTVAKQLQGYEHLYAAISSDPPL